MRFCTAGIAFASVFGISSLANAWAPTIAPVYNVNTGAIVEFTVCGRAGFGPNDTWCGKMTVPDSPYGTWTDGGFALAPDNGPSLLSMEPVSSGSCRQPYLLYRRGADGFLSGRFVCTIPGTGTFSLWGSVGQIDNQVQFLGTPSAVSMWQAPGLVRDRSFVFVRATDNTTRVIDVLNPPGTWTNLGGATYYSPSGVSPASGKMSVFITGTDNAVYQRNYTDGGGWVGTWQSLGGWVNTAPAAVSLSSGHLAVYARSGDNFLWSRSWFSAYGWGAWTRVGPDFTVTSDPAAFADPSTNKTYIVARGADNALWVYDTFGDNQWRSLGGDFSGG